MSPFSARVIPCVLLICGLVHGISVNFAHRFGGRIDDLQGKYCAGRTWGSTGSRWWAPAGRSSVCCNGRLDDCSVPIKGTLCYCDQFCDRGATHDCCPDYWDVCTDAPPPPPPPPETTARCIHNGREFNVGQTIQDNCNTCECVPSQGAAPSASCTRSKCLLDAALSTALRGQSGLGWTAVEVPTGASKGGAYAEFWGRTLADGLGMRLGTLEPDLSVQGMQKVQFHVNESVPESFDARRVWGESVISRPLDQGWCASSWSLSAAAVISDRAAIADPSVRPLMYEHLLECQASADKCAAGRLHRVWKLLSDFGAPEKQCILDKGPTEATCKPRPRGVCKRQRSGPAYRLGDVMRIQDNIRWYGPIQATMQVYQDFFHYQGGVYSRPAGSDSRESHGYHSVRIIGWGEDHSEPRRPPVPYWLAVNSWGEWWGEGGYFRIKRGVNECDIEKFMLGAWIQPELSSLSGPYRARPSSRRGRK